MCIFRKKNKVKTWTFEKKALAKEKQATLNPNKWACKITQTRKDGKFGDGWTLTAYSLPHHGALVGTRTQKKHTA